MSFRSTRSLPAAPATSTSVGDRPAIARALTRSADDAWNRVMVAALFIAALLFAFLSTRASAQQFQYDSLPIPASLADNEKLVKSLQAEARSFSTSGNGRANYVNGYLGSYVAGKMTAPDGVKHITGLMQETNKLLLSSQRSGRPDVFQKMTGYIYNAMKKVAEGNHHPAARINAALMLSRLDRRPADNNRKSPPIPVIQTLPILMTLYSDENNVDGVRAAGLQGIHRHVMYGYPQIPAGAKTQITQWMTTLLDADPPEGRSTEAHAYLQRYAVDILDMLDDATLGMKLVSISTEPKNPDLIALYSAARLKNKSQQLQGKVATPEDVLNSWSTRALSAFEGEMKRLTSFERPKPDMSQPRKPEDFLRKVTEQTRQSMMSGGFEDEMDDEMGMESMMDSMMFETDMEDDDEGMDMMMDMMMGGSSMGGAVSDNKPQPAEVVVTRCRLNHVLEQIHLGVTGQPTPGMPKTPGGLLASIPPDQRQPVVDWLTKMEEIVTGINDESLDDQTKFVEGLQTQLDALKAMIPDAAAAAPAADAPFDPLAPVDPLAPADPDAGDAADEGAAPAAAAEPVDELAG